MAEMTWRDGVMRSHGWTDNELRDRAVKPRRWVRIPNDRIESGVVMPPPPPGLLVRGPERMDALVLWELDNGGERLGLPLVVQDCGIHVVMPQDNEPDQPVPLHRMKIYLGPRGDAPDDLDALPVLDWPGLRAELGQKVAASPPAVASLAQQPVRWYVLICRECGDMEMPFSSAEERGRWAGAHARGTGHDRWLVFDLPEGDVVPRPLPDDGRRAREGWDVAADLAGAIERALPTSRSPRQRVDTDELRDALRRYEEARGQ